MTKSNSKETLKHNHQKMQQETENQQETEHLAEMNIDQKTNNQEDIEMNEFNPNEIDPGPQPQQH